MVVPQPRLLTCFAAAALPLALVGAAWPAATEACLAGVLTLVLVAVVDLVQGLRQLDGLGVKFPEVVRLSKDRPGSVEIRLQNPSAKPRRLRLAPGWPTNIASPQSDQLIALPAGAEWARLEWACTGVRRGRHRLARAWLEAPSPLGFWAARRGVPAACEFRVYPNLLADRRQLAALFLNRGALGVHARRQVGKGREFEKLRDYIHGDSFEDIHWKATAKRGRPVTKVFQVERTQEIYVVVDAARLSARLPGPTTGEPHPATVLERHLTAALLLGLAAERQGDLFGLVTFSDSVSTFVRAHNGKAHFSACRDAIYTLESRAVTPDFAELAAFLRLRLRRRALLVFLTDLDDPVLAENFTRHIEPLARQHLILVNMLKPPGVEPLFGRTEVADVDEVYERLGGHLRWQRLRELEKSLQRRGVQFALLDDEKLCAQLVTQYLNVKQRQIL
jgi:uncharacterized protein (DUF58 family)